MYLRPASISSKSWSIAVERSTCCSREYIQFGLAFRFVLSRSFRAFHLLLHVINLEGKDTQAVNSPCRTLSVDACIILNLHVFVCFAEVRIDLLHEVCSVLVALVDSALQDECFCRVNLRITDDILEMPLYGVNPALQIKTVLDATFLDMDY